MFGSTFAAVCVLLSPGQVQAAPKPELDKALVEVVRLTNVQRKKAGLAELALSDKLNAAAQFQADDMLKRKYFAHERPGGPDLGARIEKVGYTFRTVGENIAMGQRTPAEAVKGWMESKGHRENILNPDFKEIGVGFSKDKRGQIRWVQVFGASQP